MIVTRPAEPADIPAMAAMRAREWESDRYWMNRIGAYLGGDLSARESLPGRAVFVAVDDAGVVGFVAGHRTRRYGCDGELQWINVVRERRGATEAALDGVGAGGADVRAAWVIIDRASCRLLRPECWGRTRRRARCPDAALR